MSNIDETLKSSILKSLELTGSVDSESSAIIVHVNKSLDNVIDSSSGRKRIRPSKEKMFGLILSQPLSLRAISSLEIRCLACGRVISYPAWHYWIAFSVNVFHYFVCFDGREPSKPTVNCKNRR